MSFQYVVWLECGSIPLCLHFYQKRLEAGDMTADENPACRQLRRSRNTFPQIAEVSTQTPQAILRRCSRMHPTLLCVTTFILVVYFRLTASSSENKPHVHRGILPRFDGSVLSCEMNEQQEERLANNEAVSAIDKGTGKAVVVQDIAADPTICMKFIKEIQHYDKYVKSVKKVSIYDKTKDIIGAEIIKGQCKVSL